MSRKADGPSAGPGEGRRCRAAAIGLTGGQAAGKSTALELFSREGARVVSADRIVADLYCRADVVSALRERFGIGAVDGDVVDVAALREVTRRDLTALDWLEAYLHPLVGREVGRILSDAAADEVVVVEIPLLFEAGLDELFDVVVAIEAPRDVRRKRASGRPGRDLFDRLDRRQLSSEERRAAADAVFVNDGRPEDMAQFVREAMNTARRRAGA